ncbi:DinB family protein [Aegicerativicinus sediminis]|uniref:DinB family protein n=1 Tax=Aegicerativicinus sediminis TaxID=2893202 RepID=UPI001E53CBEC|nr:DinB family protein [Aegicerativicinus sediminis]
MTTKDLPYLPEYFDRYINLVNKEKDLISIFEETKLDFENHRNWLENHSDFRYQPEKWTPRDILQHLIDNERIQSYRALVFSRNDHAVLPGYDENLYADNTSANMRSITDLLEEFTYVRNSTIKLFSSFSKDQLLKEGICFELKITVLALGFQIVGHQIHHLKVLQERYMTNL